MAKKNKTLIDEIFESDWMFSAVIAITTLLIAFVGLPQVMSGMLAKAVLPTIQFFAKGFILFCSVVSALKLIRQLFKKHKESDFFSYELDSPVGSSNKKINTLQRAKVESVSDKNKVEHVKPNQALNTNSQVATQKQWDIKGQWTLEFINSLDWNVFESLCSHYFSAIGVKNSETGLGADGGVDLFLFDSGENKPTSIVQCKRSSNPIKVGVLREFYGVMHQHEVNKGYFFTTNKFYQTAIKFAGENDIELIDGALLISLLKNFTTDKQQEIYDAITQGDYTTPTCVRCGKKMVRRTNKKTKEEFWGCNTYRCRSTLSIKSASGGNKKRNSLLL